MSHRDCATLGMKAAQCPHFTSVLRCSLSSMLWERSLHRDHKSAPWICCTLCHCFWLRINFQGHTAIYRGAIQKEGPGRKRFACPWDILQMFIKETAHWQHEETGEGKNWRVIQQTFSCHIQKRPISLHYPWSQLVTAHGFLLVHGAALDMCHHPVVSCDGPRRLTKLQPKREAFLCCSFFLF